jgi:NADPH-dependent glutamate synthase beta subunit-like oxidoreductase
LSGEADAKRCLECGTCTSNCPVAELIPEHYNPRALLSQILLSPDRAQLGHEVWLCAWCYRCYDGCPQAIRLPEIFLLHRVAAVKKRRLDGLHKAMKIIGERVPLPAVCIRACFHPERGRLDGPLVMAPVMKLIAKYESDMLRGMPKVSSGPSELGLRVAIVGSGPTGLAAAHDLLAKGYRVDVLESLPKLGGMLRVGLPQYRLPQDVLDREIKRLIGLGLKAKTNVSAGKDFTIEELKGKYDAVLIATGAHRSTALRVEGEELKGVIRGLEFLRKTKLGERVRLGRTVVVIGGGNVAIDAARTAVRLGAKVTLLYRRTKEEMPANPWEVAHAVREGVRIRYLVAPKRILGRDGRVVGVECVRMRLGERDETGRRRPIVVEGSELHVKADTVMPAIGELPDTSFLPQEIRLSDRGAVLTDVETMETSLEGVFAAGDVASGPASVIEAVARGRRAAQAIDIYLRRGSQVEGGTASIELTAGARRTQEDPC